MEAYAACPACNGRGGRLRARIGVSMAAKLALVVRTDLGMGRGKIAAQVAHAAVAAVLANGGSRDFAAWLAEGQPKVVLKVASAEQLAGVIRGAAAADENDGLAVGLSTTESGFFSS